MLFSSTKKDLLFSKGNGKSFFYFKQQPNINNQIFEQNETTHRMRTQF